MQKTNKKISRNKEEAKNRQLLVNLTKIGYFKNYFTLCKPALKSLIKAFLPLPDKSFIQEVILLDSVLPELTKEENKSLMNLRLQLNTGELISVVIQAFLPKHFSERIVFYWAKHYVSQLTEEECTSISFSYSLIFSKFDLFPNQERNFSGVSSGKPCNSFSFRPNKAPERFSFLDLQFVTVELSKFKSEGDMSTLVKFQDIWCYLLKNSMKIGQEEFKELSGRAPEMEEAMAYLRKFSNKDNF